MDLSIWLIGALILALALIPCVVVSLTAAPVDRLVALELAGVISSLMLILLAQGLRNDLLLDLAIASALLSFSGGLVFAHFMERWV